MYRQKARKPLLLILALTMMLVILSSCSSDKSFNLVGKWHSADDSNLSPDDFAVTDVYTISDSGSIWKGDWEYEILGETEEGFVLVTKLYRDRAWADEMQEKTGAIVSTGWEKNTYDVSIIDKDHFKYTHIENTGGFGYDLDVTYERVK
jgi:hypothetical protein